MGPTVCSPHTGGSCTVFWCHSWRGPTTCVGHNCLCDEGTCAIGGTCVPEVGFSNSTMATGLAAPELSNGAVFASAFLASIVVSGVIGAVMVSRCRHQGADYERLLESEAQVA